MYGRSEELERQIESFVQQYLYVKSRILILPTEKRRFEVDFEKMCLLTISAYSGPLKFGRRRNDGT